MQNEHIIQALTSYIENPDPCYALMLKGKWGCGKTWLVSKWIDDTFRRPENKDDAVLNPIRITLYGMSNVDEITKAIDRQLHPFLYSKVAKVGKGILKVAGKIVLRTDLDFDKDGKGDTTLTTSLDSLAFLASKDKDIKSDSTWLLVFDDIERTHIPIKQLLGYINYFVEYCGCHVIIVGDETKITDDEDKKTLQDFKEKTVGKEYEVKPDIDAAIANFVDELPHVEWLNGQRELIEKIFVASQCDNLRILRQCLYDFKLLYNEVDFQLMQKDTHVMRELLGSFVALYCEYKGQGREAMKRLSKVGPGYYLFDKEDTPERRAISQLKMRYEPSKTDGINVLNQNHVNNILTHIEQGLSMKQYVDRLMKASQTKDGVIDRLCKFREMDDDAFAHDCEELSQKLKDGEYRQFYQIGRALALFSLFEKEDLYHVDDTILEQTKKTIQVLFDDDIHDKDTLYKCRTEFWQGLNIVENSNEAYRIHNELGAFFTESFHRREAALPDKMQQALNTLTNENVRELISIDESSTPDQHSLYSHTSILKDQDAEALMERIRGLSNSNIRQFALFLAYHYAFSYQLGDSYQSYFKEDETVLKSLQRLTEKEIENSAGIRRYSFQYLLKVLEGCVKRCEGERGGLMNYM